MKKKRILSLMAAAAMTSSLMYSAVAPVYAVNTDIFAVPNAVADTKKAVEREPSAEILYGEISRQTGYFSSVDETDFAELLDGMIEFYNKNGIVSVDSSGINFYSEETGGYVSTPQELYDAVGRQGGYELEIDCNGETITNADGEPFKFTAYIGVMGDTNLDGVVNAVDASNILNYYAEVSVGYYDTEYIPICPESQNPDIIVGSEIENLCAFLADVNQESDRIDHDNNNFLTKAERLIDPQDSSNIIKDYAQNLLDMKLVSDITNGYTRQQIEESSVQPRLDLKLESSNWFSDTYNYGYYDDKNTYMVNQDYYNEIDATLKVDISGLENYSQSTLQKNTKVI